MQERLTSTLYPSPAGLPEKFRSFLLLNTLQALMSALVAWLSVQANGIQTKFPSEGLLRGYLRIALTGCLASPFGYAALKHVSYPTVVLGKSCKLLPLVLLNSLIYRNRFDTYKYITVLLITVGVAGFMLFDHRASDSGKSDSMLGISLLLINLLLDGATNSCQDSLFLKYKIRSHHMMLFMNLFSALFLSAFLIVSNPFTNQLTNSFKFISDHPMVIRDILLFCICGALGQIFIFLTIEHYGSLLLVTVTVTRKLFTILLSLFWFDHRLNGSQWLCVGLVFVALAIESLFKPSGHHHRHQKIGEIENSKNQ